MRNRGKSINLYLIDGDASGRIKCTLANWTGIAYKIPRTDLEKSKDRVDLRNSGVYLLLGKNEETDKSSVYIGQAGSRKNGEGLLNRILEHKRNSEKDYFTEVICLTTVINSFGPTEISYLENRFCELASIAGRYEVRNSNQPSLGNVTEEKESELEEFIDYAKIIMGALGHKVFVPLITRPSYEEAEKSEEQEPQLLHTNRQPKRSKTKIKGLGMETSEGFVVLKGSVIEKTDLDHVSPHIAKMRENAKFDGNVLAEDILFTSPSAAAMFIFGGSANGLDLWKNEKGKKLKDL